MQSTPITSSVADKEFANKRQAKIYRKNKNQKNENISEHSMDLHEQQETDQGQFYEKQVDCTVSENAKSQDPSIKEQDLSAIMNQINWNQQQIGQIGDTNQNYLSNTINQIQKSILSKRKKSTTQDSNPKSKKIGSAIQQEEQPDDDDSDNEIEPIESQIGINNIEDEEESEGRKQKRLFQNRKSAQKCRLKKKAEFQSMSQRFKTLQDENMDLKEKLNKVTMMLYQKIEGNQTFQKRMEQNQIQQTMFLTQLVLQSQQGQQSNPVDQYPQGEVINNNNLAQLIQGISQMQDTQQMQPTDIQNQLISYLQSQQKAQTPSPQPPLQNLGNQMSQSPLTPQQRILQQLVSSNQGNTMFPSSSNETNHASRLQQLLAFQQMSQGQKGHDKSQQEREPTKESAFHHRGSANEKTSEPNQYACDNTTIATNFGANNQTVNKNSNQASMIQNLLSDHKNQSITIAELLKKVQSKQHSNSESEK